MRSLAPCLAVVVALAGCQRAKETPPAPAPATEPAAGSAAPVKKIFANGATEASPLIVALHGRGDTPEGFAELWRDLPLTVEIAIPQAFTPYSDGFSWYDPNTRSDDDAFAEAISRAEQKLWPLIVELAHGRPVIVTGFSQGGTLSYALAARHPDAIRYAFPIAGHLPAPLWPKARTAPVFALHGTEDNWSKIELVRATVAAFVQTGSTAELREYAAGHTVSRPMYAELVARLRALVAPP